MYLCVVDLGFGLQMLARYVLAASFRAFLRVRVTMAAHDSQRQLYVHLAELPDCTVSTPSSPPRKGLGFGVRASGRGQLSIRVGCPLNWGTHHVQSGSCGACAVSLTDGAQIDSTRRKDTG